MTVMPWLSDMKGESKATPYRDIPPFRAGRRHLQLAARTAFPRGNLYMRMRDERGGISEDEAFTALFSPRGQPAEAPWRLALITIMQYAEGLSDRQAADAVRSRIKLCLFALP